MTSRELIFFPGCSLEGTATEYGQSTLAVLDVLERPIRVLDDWNCCGATAARSIDPELSIRLCARNLSLAAKQGCDLLVNCAACYNNLAHSRCYLESHPDLRRRFGMEPEAVESVEVHHLLNLLTTDEMLDRLRRSVTRRLDGMRLACYYGCLLVRPDESTQVDDPEDPQVMDDLMRICGAQTIDWSYKTDCCGGSFSLTSKDSALKLIERIFAAALEQDVTGIVTACPLCQMNLDAWQREIGKAMGRKVSIPVFYFTELLALAMDLEGVRRWFRSHMTSARRVLRKCR